MTTAKQIMSQLDARIKEREAQAKAVGAVYKFVLDGEGGGTFIVNLKDNIGVTEADGAAPCTISMSAADAVDLLQGRANGQALFFSQRLKVEGDLALALKLQALTDILK